ncbi:MAG: hypothetical protein ACTH1D_05135 [Mycobacteriaceae bacterium]
MVDRTRTRILHRALDLLNDPGTDDRAQVLVQVRAVLDTLDGGGT